MLKETLIEIYVRELNKLKEEVSSYNKAENLWKISGDIKNSGGNLCLHILGNIQHYIGAVLGKTGYIRQRDLEFSGKNIPATELTAEIEHTISTVSRVVNSLDEKDFEKDFPVEVLHKKTSTGFFLVHIVSHMSYHIGQINYHRRLLDV